MSALDAWTLGDVWRIVPEIFVESVTYHAPQAAGGVQPAGNQVSRAWKHEATNETVKGTGPAIAETTLVWDLYTDTAAGPLLPVPGGRIIDTAGTRYLVQEVETELAGKLFSCTCRKELTARVP